MTEEELDALLTELEDGLREDVRAALALTADEFMTALDGATELVAARFSVSGIRDMWRRRVGPIMGRLSGIAGRGADAVASDLDAQLPDGWDSGLSAYVEETQALLDAVGDRLANEATAALAEGLNAGEDVTALRDRLAAVFADGGTQLGDGRAARIAATEATRAWNAGEYAAATALTGPDRPLVKQWVTRRDEFVRPAHREANGQLRLLDEPFDVGGDALRYPGDPEAPADQTIYCRCVMKVATADRGEATASMGEVADMLKEMAAAAEVHTGAMIALLPTDADATRIALEGGEDAAQLHTTLYFLGEAADWTDEQRGHLISRVSDAAARVEPINARVFGAAQWNPTSDEPAWVWSVGNDSENDSGPYGQLEHARYETTHALEDGHDDPQLPRQHTPWVAHITAAYSSDDWRERMQAHVGPVTFDRIRVAFGGHNTDIPLTGPAYQDEPAEPEVEVEPMPQTIPWHTPDDTALAFEDQQTGDGRVFSPGALYWNDGPWPLQYAGEMNGGHDGARLAGAIQSMGRDGGRIAASGVLYPTLDAGAEAAMLLAQGAPLGVSVDLDDVDVSLVDASGGSESYSLAAASLLRLADGSYHLTGETTVSYTASGSGTAGVSTRLDVVTDADGRVSMNALTAAAGDRGGVGVVVDTQRSGDALMRITKARVRGATLVSIPAFVGARIVLDPEYALAASFTEGDVTAAIKSTTDYDRVLRHVRASKVPSGAARVAQALKIPVVAAQRILAVAASRGEVVRLTKGLYTDKTTSAKADHLMNDNMMGELSDELAASVTGSVDLPVAPRDAEWDGDAAESEVFEWAGGDAGKIGKAFAYKDDSGDPLAKSSYKLGYARPVDGILTIIPKGVAAALGAMSGARGGVDLPADERASVQHHLESVRSHVIEETGGEELTVMQASVWAAMKDLPAMPAAWFAEPTMDELPPGGPGVNYSNGRIYGWVAQADEPHAGFAKKITINSLGRIDTTHFLRQRFTLDDGSTIKAGSFTMNAGHHRDGAECETSACQFDDTRTVAGIVTVGMNAGGMWFSGAAAPWLSEWDRSVFMSCNPSYHMKKGPDGRWQLRAVLTVPVPGHSSPLLASAVIERAQLALTAAAMMTEVEEAIATEEAVQAAEATAVASHDVAGAVPGIEDLDYDRLAESMVAAIERAEERKAAEAAQLAALREEAAELDIS